MLEPIPSLGHLTVDANTVHEQVEKVRISNHKKRNVLHLVALHASTEAMDLLATANLHGLDTLSRDRNGHTPDECFVECRNSHCAVARKPFDVERRSWARLMKSMYEQAAVLPDFDDADEDTELLFKDIAYENKTSSRLTEISSDCVSEDEYMDAEDGTEEISLQILL